MNSVCLGDNHNERESLGGDDRYEWMWIPAAVCGGNELAVVQLASSARLSPQPTLNTVGGGFKCSTRGESHVSVWLHQQHERYVTGLGPNRRQINAAALFLGLMCQFDQRSEYLKELGEPREEAAFPWNTDLWSTWQHAKLLQMRTASSANLWLLIRFLQTKVWNHIKVLTFIWVRQLWNVCKQKVVIRVLKQQSEGAHHH